MSLDLIYAIWLIPYFLGIMLITWLGNYGGGLGIIGNGWDYALLLLFSSSSLIIATKNIQTTEETQGMLAEESLIPFIMKHDN